jgi:hypothetical protein
MRDESETWSIALPRHVSVRNGLTGALGGRGGRHADVLFDHLHTHAHCQHARERTLSRTRTRTRIYRGDLLYCSNYVHVGVGRHFDQQLLPGSHSHRQVSARPP